MKTCRVCAKQKPMEAFDRDKSRSDGRRSLCKVCRSHYLRDYYENNKERIGATSARWHADNFARKTANMNRWVAENRSRSNEIKKRWAKNNPENVCSLIARRQGADPRATPRWANLFFISEAYDLARLRTKMLGFPWHVDHIVPIHSPVVCGLHVESNLQVIPGSVNAAKSNRHWPQMPEAING